MAMFAPIPLPDSGNQVFKDVMDYFETLQKRKTQQAQFGQQLAINKQAESRAQQLLPLQIQQYKDTHNREASEFEIQQMYNALQKDSIKKYLEAQKAGNTTFGGTPGSNGIGMPSPVPGAMPGGSPDAVAQPSTQQSPEDKQAADLGQNASFPAIPGLGQLNDLMQQNQTPNTPANATAAMPSPPPMPMMPGAAIPPVNNQAPMMNAGQGAMPSPVPASAPNPTPQMNGTGQEIVLRQGNPAIAFMDTLGAFNPKFPKPQTHIGANGVVYTTYPSGKMTMMQPAPGMKTVAQETPEERQKREVNTAEQKEEAKANVKEKGEADKYFKNLAEYAGNNEAVAHIMERNPGVSGIFSAGKKFFKMGDKDLAAFNRLAVPMVGQLAHEISQRGGAVAARLAGGGKFDSTQPVNYNQGILEENNNAIIRDYNREAAAYKEKHGVEPPYKLPKYYRDWEKSHPEGSQGASTQTPNVTKWVMKGGKLEKA